MSRKVLRIIAVVVGLLGLFLLVDGFLFYRSSQSFLQNSITASGTVVGYELDESDGDTYYHPQVVFSTADGQSIEFTSSTAKTTEQYEIGETVAIRYDPATPSRASIDSPQNIWFGTIIFGGLGAICLLVAGGIWIATMFTRGKTIEADGEALIKI